MIQGHDEEQCYVKNHELYKKKSITKGEEYNKECKPKNNQRINKEKEIINKKTQGREEGSFSRKRRMVGGRNNLNRFGQRCRRKTNLPIWKNKEDKREQAKKNQLNKDNDNNIQSTKEWVEGTFQNNKKENLMGSSEKD